MGILQERILEWVAMPSSRGSSQPRDWTQVSPHCRQIFYHLSHQGSLCVCVCVCVCVCTHSGGLVSKSRPTLATPWTLAHQAPLSMGFPGKNTGVGCHFLLQEIFPAQGSNPHLQYYRQSPVLQADSLPIEPLGKLSPVLYIYTLVYSVYSQIFIKVADIAVNTLYVELKR